MRPHIGVLSLHDCEKQTLWINPLYFGGVEQAGGLPSLLPLTDDPACWEAYCQGFDGFVFTGGQDVAPSYFSQEKLPQCGYQSPERDAQELFMLRRLRELDKPVLGICRGLQAINVALGGTLYQDLPTQHPSQVVHRQTMPFDLPHHQVEIFENSMLRSLVGHAHLSVNSMHHQAVWEVAPGLSVAAAAPDGIVEALELPGARFFLGVQWHPEHMWQSYDSGKRIFQGLVDACRTTK
jgi:putative glutamine amidotransferase